MSIKRLSIVTAQGASTHIVGRKYNGVALESIEEGVMRTNGDSFQHYIGYDKSGNVIFTVDKLCPCEVEYFVNQQP